MMSGDKLGPGRGPESEKFFSADIEILAPPPSSAGKRRAE
jgi:hypothetical protein